MFSLDNKLCSQTVRASSSLVMPVLLFLFTVFLTKSVLEQISADQIRSDQIEEPTLSTKLNDS